MKVHCNFLFLCARLVSRLQWSPFQSQGHALNYQHTDNVFMFQYTLLLFSHILRSALISEPLTLEVKHNKIDKPLTISKYLFF